MGASEKKYFFNSPNGELLEPNAAEGLFGAGQNILAEFKLSGYLTLVDEEGKPVVYNFNGRNYIFSFKKEHLGINLCKTKKGFSFFEKLFIAGLLKDEYKWKNLISLNLKSLLSKYEKLEPRNFTLEISQKGIKYLINKGTNIEEIETL